MGGDEGAAGSGSDKTTLPPDQPMRGYHKGMMDGMTYDRLEKFCFTYRIATRSYACDGMFML